MNYAFVRADPAFVVPLNTYKAIQFTLEDHDPAGFFNPASNTRFTIPAGVTKVKMVGSIDFNLAAADLGSALNLRKNGGYTIDSNYLVEFHKGAENAPGWSNNNLLLESPVLPVVEGDYFELFCVTSHASVTGIRATDNTWFSIMDESDSKGVLLYRTSDINVGSLSAAIRPLPFNGVAYNDGNAYDPAEPEFITIPPGVTGVRVYGCSNFLDVSGESYYVNYYLYKNNLLVGGPGGFSYYDHPQESYGNDQWWYRFGIIPVEEGDELKVLVFSDNGNFNTMEIGSYVQYEFLTGEPMYDNRPRNDFLRVNKSVAGYEMVGKNRVTNVSAGSNRGEVHMFKKNFYPGQNGFYMEWEINNRVGTNAGYVGVCAQDQSPANYGIGWRATGTFWTGAVQRQTGLPTWTTGDILMMYYAPGGGSLWVGKNGVWNRDPAVLSANGSIDVLYDFSGLVVSPAFTLRDQGDSITFRDGVHVPCLYEPDYRKFADYRMMVGDTVGEKPWSHNPYDFYLDGNAYPNGSGTIYEITTNRSIVNNGATVTSPQMVFSGSSGVNISLPSAQGELGDSDFDLYAKFTPDVIVGTLGVVSKYEAVSNNRSWLIRTNGSDIEFYGSVDGVTPILMLSQTAALAVGVPISVQVRRRGATLELLVNGSIVDTYSIGTTVFHSALSTLPLVGSYGTGTEFDGNIEYVGLEIY